MTAAEEHPRLHYLSPCLVLAYAWAYAFTVFATLVGLTATHIWSAKMTWLAVTMGFGALFALVVGLRPLVIALIEDLGIREKMGIFLLLGMLFVSPKLITPRATLIDCLIVLQIPLVAQLVKRENFLQLYGVNFLLVCLGTFVAWQTEGGGFEWAGALVVCLAGCFAADRFFLELERYPNLAAQPVGRPLLLGIQYGAVALIGGTLLYLVTPELAMAPRAETARTVVGRPGGAQTLSLRTLWDLAWQTVLLMVLIIATLAVLQWLKKKYRRTEGGKDSAIGDGVMRMVRKILRPTPRPPQMRRGFSPREQILRGYWAWCDEMERFGLVRRPEMTPKEYARAIAQTERQVASPVGELTGIFEQAKYDRREPAARQVEDFFGRSRQVI